MKFVSDKLVNQTSKKCFDGIQHLFEFNNGYAASVIKHSYSYGGRDGLWELALMRDNNLIYNDEFPDVVGRLNDAEVDQMLKRISTLEHDEAGTDRVN